MTIFDCEIGIVRLSSPTASIIYSRLSVLRKHFMTNGLNAE